MQRRVWFTLILCLCGCGVQSVAPQQRVVAAQYDTQKSLIPLPNDILRDARHQRLDIPDSPADLEEKSLIERQVIAALNQRDGWPTHKKASLTFDGPLLPDSISDQAVRLFRIDDEGYLQPVDILINALPEDAPQEITIEAARGYWRPKTTYVAVVMGAQNGLRGLADEPVVADATFWFLRLADSLLSHQSAIPGEDFAERQKNTEDLEDIRQRLAPHFLALKRLGIARHDIVSMWCFTTTAAPEILMDKDAQKMPLPSDFLRDPQTGKIDLPVDINDTNDTRQTKQALNQYDGFSLSADLTFEVSLPLDANTLNADTVKLYALSETKIEQVPLDFALFNDNTEVVLSLRDTLLEPATEHILVISPGLKSMDGISVVPMMPGLLSLLDAEVAQNGRSTLDQVTDESALKVEFVRQRVRRGLIQLQDAGVLDRMKVAAAWSFKTLSFLDKLKEFRDLSVNTNTDVQPMRIIRRSALEAVMQFPLGYSSMFHVSDVFEGYLEIPDRLDEQSRQLRPDDQWRRRQIPFTMTIPKGVSPDQPLKVAVFAHAIKTERRFVLALADALAKRGYAAFAIDLPFHGERSQCAALGPICFMPPWRTDNELVCPPVCQSGLICGAKGQCHPPGAPGAEKLFELDDKGLARWPVLPMYVASGDAFLEMGNLTATRDHFWQALSDMSAVLRSLRQGNWHKAIGYRIDPDLAFVGQSLGAMVGSLVVAMDPALQRVVLNVPGADLIEVFHQSTWFKQHLEHYFNKHQIERGSPRERFLLNGARWLMDPVDPQNVATYLLQRSVETMQPYQTPRRLLIQMATLDFVIPNAQTRWLTHLSGAEQRDYVGEHAFLVIPFEPAFLRGVRELAEFVATGVVQ